MAIGLFRSVPINFVPVQHLIEYSLIRRLAQLQRDPADFTQKVMPTLSINPEIRQEAGIRPTTLDKQPFIGHHPKHPELIIFNGFGAKGSLQIPWYCQCLANNLMYNQAIPENSHIMRYASLSL